MTAISAELGGSKATLWRYFPSKEKLLSSVIEEKISNYQKKIQYEIDRPDGRGTEILAFFREFIARALSPEVVELYRLVISESVRFPEIGKIFQERAIQPTQEMIVHFIDRHILEGALRETDRLKAARVLTSLCTSKRYEVLVGGRAPTPAEIDVEAAFLAEVFLRAFEAN